jgi:serine/threonine-protein kinase RsbW
MRTTPKTPRDGGDGQRDDGDWPAVQAGRIPSLLEMTEDSCSIRLELRSVPACVTLVRAMLSAIGERYELTSELIDDLKTAVSEACNNVVIHAYPSQPGALVVELQFDRGELRVAVIDHGEGIRHVSATADRMGVGLAVISALADRAEFQSVADGGTAVRMSFGGDGRGGLADGRAAPDLAPAPDAPTGDVMIRVAPVGMLGDVLGRVSRALAAGAQFSLDRFSDLYLVTDEIAAQVRSSAGAAEIGCALTGAAGRLEMVVGPFREGTVSALANGQPQSAYSVSKLVDELSVERHGDGERLRVVVIDHG